MKRTAYDPLKRLFDIFASGIGLLVAAVVILLVAVINKVTSPGPIFFRQERIGRGKVPFRMIKFRTMVVDAAKLGPAITSKGDNRITPMGRILRRTKLDELPELWNVLIGDMSLVGPRPEVKFYVDQYPSEWDDIWEARPGVTDLATLEFRDEETVLAAADDRELAYTQVVLPMKIERSLHYVRNRSLMLDLKILFLTVWGITGGRYWMKPSDQFAVVAIQRVQELNRSVQSQAGKAK